MDAYYAREIWDHPERYSEDQVREAEQVLESWGWE